MWEGDEVCGGSCCGSLVVVSGPLEDVHGKTEVFKDFEGALGGRPEIARRIIARRLHQFGQELNLALKIAIDELADDARERHEASASRSTASSMTRAPISASSAVLVSRGRSLQPPLPQPTENIPTPLRPAHIPP